MLQKILTFLFNIFYNFRTKLKVRVVQAGIDPGGNEGLEDQSLDNFTTKVTAESSYFSILPIKSLFFHSKTNPKVIVAQAETRPLKFLLTFF